MKGTKSRFLTAIALLAVLALPAQAANTPAPSPLITPSPSAFGKLVYSNFKLSREGDALDLVMTIKNNGTINERMGGGESDWSGTSVVEMVKEGGTEKEVPFAIAIPAGQTVELSKSTMWIRVKGAAKQMAGAPYFPVNFYFRSSPNAMLKLSISDVGSSSSKGWFN